MGRIIRTCKREVDAMQEMKLRDKHAKITDQLIQTYPFGTSADLITKPKFLCSSRSHFEKATYIFFHLQFIICAASDNTMAKKRKVSRGSGGRKAANGGVDLGKSKFAVDEEFLDSEDEFEAGRDQVLLDERPEAKRRRKLEEQGAYI